jgi:ribosome-binding protein aMBF1 (putative translation factor)
MSTNNILKKFGQRVKSLRLEKGWSQEHLSADTAADEFVFRKAKAGV